MEDFQMEYFFVWFLHFMKKLCHFPLNSKLVISIWVLVHYSRTYNWLEWKIWNIESRIFTVTLSYLRLLDLMNMNAFDYRVMSEYYIKIINMNEMIFQFTLILVIIILPRHTIQIKFYHVHYELCFSYATIEKCKTPDCCFAKVQELLNIVIPSPWCPDLTAIAKHSDHLIDKPIVSKFNFDQFKLLNYHYSIDFGNIHLEPNIVEFH